MYITSKIYTQSIMHWTNGLEWRMTNRVVVTLTLVFLSVKHIIHDRWFYTKKNEINKEYSVFLNTCNGTMLTTGCKQSTTRGTWITLQYKTPSMHQR